MHDAILTLAGYLAEPIPADTSNAKAAIFTAIGVVLAAVVTGFFATRQRFPSDRARPDNRPGNQLIKELTRRAVAAETENVGLRAEITALDARVDELEGFCWTNNINPHTGGRHLHP